MQRSDPTSATAQQCRAKQDQAQRAKALTRTTGRTAATRHTKIIGKAVIVLVIVACVTDLVSIPILLVHVGYGRAIVGRIAPSVAIHVVFARISNPRYRHRLFGQRSRPSYNCRCRRAHRRQRWRLAQADDRRCHRERACVRLEVSHRCPAVHPHQINRRSSR